MSRLISLSVIFLVAAAGIASADIIYLKNGNAFEVQDAVVKGDFVYFSIHNGTMSIELSAVERIEKIEGSAGGALRLVDSFSSSDVATATGNLSAAISRSGDAAAGREGQQTGQGNEELIQFYIAQKQQLERENYFFRENIQTLNSVIYGKAVTFSDSSPERRRIADLEQLIQRNQEKIRQLLQDARNQGLLPGDIRKIEDAKFQAPTSSTQTGTEGEEPLYMEEAEEPLYEYEEPEEEEEEGPPGFDAS